MISKIPNQEKVWDKIARKWDLFRNKPLKCVKDFLERKEGKVLDLGCGSGRNFIRSDKLEFYGVDFSEEMVELAKKYAGEKGLDVEVRKAQAWDLPFKDNFFDYVLFVATLHCIESEEKRKKSLEELRRVLKPGGRALITVVLGDKIKKFNVEGDEAKVSWIIKNKGKEDEKVWRYYRLYNKDEIKKLLSRYFKVVNTNFDSKKSKFDRRNLIIEVSKT